MTQPPAVPPRSALKRSDNGSKLLEMSLGRLLRRASSKASDLLTFNPGSGGSRSILDGEIIYSKNNVCVHPSELLQGTAEHHPGYLCIHMERDEFLGTTLVLAWVPNSRIQRQDEEALRYITPESSPVRKAPRRRGKHTQGHGRAQAERREPARIGEAEQILSVSPRVTDPVHLADTPFLETTSTRTTHSDSGILSTISGASEEEEDLPGDGAPEAGEDEGLCDLSADDVSRDSTMGSDSDTLSSPFCLSPISEALGESSSVFLDNESRETCDDPMTHSASSASSLDNNAAFLENNSQSQNSKWEEQQKVLALEQLCGVFRVDLGQMRSLRLFFSDEACTSGQLVVASRESQYKIFHFHHGGLDKLAEVFQQWKCCRETQLKDQVAYEKSCMQFSIQRPNLPSTETHPEENMYKRLDVSTWLKHLNETGQVEEEYKLRKAIFFGGIEPSIRGEVWPFLLRYYSYESTSEERESLRVQKRLEYEEIQQRRLSMTPEEHKEFWRKVQFTVDKDVVRTDRSNQFFRGENNPNVEIMRRILLNYAVFNPEIGYSQGMSDLVAPILTEVQDESDTYWCFVGLMQNTIFISSPRDEDMEKQLMYLRELLRLMHPRLYQHLVMLGEDGLQVLFCHRWILLCFKREFPDAEALRMWEACWAHYQTDYFHLFICVAIIVIYGDDVIEQQLATDQMLLHFSNLAMHMNGEVVLRKARSLLYQFRLLPRVPCSLHDLCKLCGPGMWDSCYIPAVECSGNHPGSESCPYGGTVEAPSPKQASEGKKGSKTRDIFNFHFELELF
ncbi:TBC1 domain family member 16 [Polyodon spathula]|uniref:TBC1 domain family member 16 n=1 Tax=Polyodon spathula TaxID=7913 RepID=UPI001B7DB28A|nr:TBC1 domain family member 16 [Polyodon spathula]